MIFRELIAECMTGLAEGKDLAGLSADADSWTSSSKGDTSTAHGDHDSHREAKSAHEVAYTSHGRASRSHLNVVGHLRSKWNKLSDVEQKKAHAGHEGKLYDYHQDMSVYHDDHHEYHGNTLTGRNPARPRSSHPARPKA